MPTVEERVAYLEGKVEEHSRGFGELREMVIHLDQKVDRFREELMGANVATNSRIDALEQRLSGRIDALDQRLSARIEALDQKVSKQFIWLVGIQIMVLLAVIGALLGK